MSELLRDVLDIQVRQLGVDALCQAILGQKLAVSRRSGGKAGRHADAEAAQMADHFSERGVLAPDALDVVHPEFGKRYNVFSHTDVPLGYLLLPPPTGK